MTIKKLTDSKIFWMLVSLVLSLVLWVFVSSTVNDTISKSFSGVPVELAGESILHESKGLTVSDLSSNTISFVITGPRRIVSSLSSDNLKATIDVSKLSQAAYASMQYSISFPSGIDTSALSVSRKVPDSINFLISKIVEKEIPVKVNFKGYAEEGYTVESAVSTPTTITVSGPEATVNSISSAAVELTAEGITSTHTEDVGFILVNDKGDEISKDGITCSTDIVTVTIPILEMKDVNLAVSIIPGGGAGENNINITVEPQTITVKGDSAEVNSLNQITLGTIDLSLVESSPFTKTFTINLDNALTNVSGETEATATVELLGLDTKKVEVKDIRLENIPDGYEVSLVTKSLSVKFRGTAEALELLQDAVVYASVDMTEFANQTGNVDVPVKIVAEGVDGCGAVGAYTISASLKKVG